MILDDFQKKTNEIRDEEKNVFVIQHKKESKYNKFGSGNKFLISIQKR